MLAFAYGAVPSSTLSSRCALPITSSASAPSTARPARRRNPSHRHRTTTRVSVAAPRAPPPPPPPSPPSPPPPYMPFPPPSLLEPSLRPSAAPTQRPSSTDQPARPLTLHAANRRLKSLSKRPKSLQTCLAVFDQLHQQRITPDKYTYSLLLTACARAGATNEAMRLYQLLQQQRVPLDNHLRVNLLTVIARSKQPHVPLALRIFSSSPTRSTALCNVLIDVFVATHNAHAAQAVHRYMTGASIPPDAYTVSALIRAHVATGGPYKALTALRDMWKCGLSVHSSAFGQVISAFGRIGHVDQAVALFDEMTVFGVSPTQNTFNILIAACEGRDSEKAFEIFEEMIATTAFKGDRYTYHALIKCALSQRDTARVRELYARIKQSRFQPNQVSYRMALDAAGMGMDLDFVEQIVSDVKRNECVLRMDGVATLVAACIRCSDLQAALAHFSAFVNCGRCEAEHAFFEDIRRALRRFDCDSVCDSGHTKRVVDELERSWRREA